MQVGYFVHGPKIVSFHFTHKMNKSALSANWIKTSEKKLKTWMEPTAKLNKPGSTVLKDNCLMNI